MDTHKNKGKTDHKKDKKKKQTYNPRRWGTHIQNILIVLLHWRVKRWHKYKTSYWTPMIFVKHFACLQSSVADRWPLHYVTREAMLCRITNTTYTSNTLLIMKSLIYSCSVWCKHTRTLLNIPLFKERWKKRVKNKFLHTCRSFSSHSEDLSYPPATTVNTQNSCYSFTHGCTDLFICKLKVEVGLGEKN